MAPSGLGEGALAEHRRQPALTAGGVIPVDERAEREEYEVLADRHAEGEPPWIDVDPAPQLVEGEPEHGPVADVDREAGRPPAWAARGELPQQRDVRVVVAERSLVDRLLECPDGGGRGPGGG
jgi:hypothetical protein